MEPSRNKAICVPFEKEEHYRELVENPDELRRYLSSLFARHHLVADEKHTRASGRTVYIPTRPDFAVTRPLGVLHSRTSTASHIITNWLHNFLIASSMGGRKR